MPHRIHLLVGPSEDPATLTPIAPNPPAPQAPARVSPSTRIRVHIHSFAGTPPPQTDAPPYFSHADHAGDRFSIHFFFTPPADVGGDDLVIANTFSRPIRDRLPFFFAAAWRALLWIDPGITGDVYADAPEIASPVLSSAGFVGADDPPTGTIAEDMPPDVPAAPANRKRHFLNPAKRKSWTFRAGTEYAWDFCNGMMDCNDLSVRIPGLGFKIDVYKYWDGQPLRFVLKNRATGEVYAVVQLEIREEKDGEEAGMDVAGSVVDGPEDGEIGITEIDDRGVD